LLDAGSLSSFVPALSGTAGREFVVLYLFDAMGRYREARIDDLGTRAEFEEGRACRVIAQRIHLSNGM